MQVKSAQESKNLRKPQNVSKRADRVYLVVSAGLFYGARQRKLAQNIPWLSDFPELKIYNFFFLF